MQPLRPSVLSSYACARLITIDGETVELKTKFARCHVRAQTFRVIKKVFGGQFSNS